MCQESRRLVSTRWPLPEQCSDASILQEIMLRKAFDAHFHTQDREALGRPTGEWRVAPCTSVPATAPKKRTGTVLWNRPLRLITEIGTHQVANHDNVRKLAVVVEPQLGPHCALQHGQPEHRPVVCGALGLQVVPTSPRAIGARKQASRSGGRHRPRACGSLSPLGAARVSPRR